jgi:hypothetical protein
MNAISNSYTDCRLVNLEPSTPEGPFIVSQDAYDPQDPLLQAKVFFLKRDGTWVDELVHWTAEDGGAFDIVFDRVADVMKVLAELGTTVTLDRSIPDASAVEAYLNRIKGLDAETILRNFLTRYRQSRTH